MSNEAVVGGRDADSPASVVRRLLDTSDIPWTRILALVVLIGVFAVLSPVFLTTGNFENIGRQTAIVAILAVGMTFVIVAGEIDLSVGSVVALCGMCAGLAMTHVSGGLLIGAGAAIIAGAAIGWINGILTAKWAIPSFLVTLGMLSIARGLSLLVTDTEPVLIQNSGYHQLFGDGTILGISAPIAWTIFAVVLGYLLLQRSVFGQRVLATGGNPTAARFSGVRTSRVKVWVFVISGACAGLAAVVMTSRFHAARPDVGAGLELDAIAAVILGGTSLFGGKGTIIGTLIGCLIIGVVNNGLNLMGVSSALQLAIKGAIIIAAVAFQMRK